MRELTFTAAAREGLAEEMARDKTIFVVGEGIGVRGGNFMTTAGLYDLYGPERLRDTPIVERGFVGMCTGAAMEAGVDTILFGLRAPADSGTTRVAPPVSPESQMPRIIGDVLADASRALLEEFLRRDPRPAQAAYVKQLLALAPSPSGRGTG